MWWMMWRAPAHCMFCAPAIEYLVDDVASTSPAAAAAAAGVAAAAAAWR